MFHLLWVFKADLQPFSSARNDGNLEAFGVDVFSRAFLLTQGCLGSVLRTWLFLCILYIYIYTQSHNVYAFYMHIYIYICYIYI